MSSNNSTILAHDNRPVETTPLLLRPSSGPRRVRYTNTSSFLPKRRYRAKSRPSKFSDTTQIYIAPNDDDSSKQCQEYSSDQPSSPVTLESPSTTLEDDAATWQSLCNAAQKCPPNTRPLLLSQLNSRLTSNVSLTLENSGSVARDHLASERTFLAYMRTSLALASSGVALVQLFTVASSSSKPLSGAHRIHAYIRPLGATTILMGLIVLTIGVSRYFAVQAALTKGFFPAARIALGAIALALAVLVTLTFWILMAGKLEPKGRF